MHDADDHLELVPVTSPQHAPRPGPLSFEQALAQYQGVYLAARNLAERSRREYVADITDLIRFLTTPGGPQAPRQVDQTDLQNYLAGLDRRGLAGSSRRRKVFAIKSFFSFLADSRVIPVNPADKLIPPGAEQR